MKRAKAKKLPKQTKKSPPTKVKTAAKTSFHTDDGVPKSKIMSCIVTGLERRVSKAGIMKGNRKFGGPVGFAEHYISNEAKRLLRQRV
jgi:hypothetical protein